MKCYSTYTHTQPYLSVKDSAAVLSLCYNFAFRVTTLAVIISFFLTLRSRTRIKNLNSILFEVQIQTEVLYGKS